MESRFPQRVELERACLDKVNEVFRDGPALVGLSNKTISVWIRDIVPRIGGAAADRLSSALRVAADAARSEADISDEVFVDVEPAEAEFAKRTLEAALMPLRSVIGRG
jgi:hypothetical protein